MFKPTTMLEDSDLDSEQRVKIVTVMTYAAGTSCHVVLRPKTAGKRNAWNIYFSVLFGSPHKSYYIDYGRVIVTYNVDKKPTSVIVTSLNACTVL